MVNITKPQSSHGKVKNQLVHNAGGPPRGAAGAAMPSFCQLEGLGAQAMGYIYFASRQSGVTKFRDNYCKMSQK